MARPIGVLAALIVLAVALAAPAMAQETIDAQMFRPSIFNGNFIAIEDAHTLDAMCYGFGLYVNHANTVVEVREKDSSDFKTGVLNSVTTINGTAAFSPFSWLSLGVDVPVHVQSRAKRYENIEISPNEEGEDPGDQGFEDNAALGDIKAELKLGLLKEANAGIGIAVAGFGTFPTGDEEIFLGEGTTNFGGKAMIEKDLGIFNVGLNGGYLVRPSRTVFGTDISDAYLFGAGISRTIVGGLSFSIEFFGTSFITQEGDDVQPNPMEVLGFLRYKFGNSVRLIGGGGAGLSSGIGAPAYRAVAGIDYYPHCEGPTQGKLLVNVVNEDGIPVKAGLKVAGPSGALAPKGTPSKTFAVETEDSGEYYATVDPGDYAMAAVAPGYLPSAAKGTVLIGKTTKVTITLALKKAPTTLEVNVLYKKNKELIPGAAILVKDKATGKITAYKADTGQWKGKYEPGDYTFSGFIAGFEKVDLDATVVKEKHNVVNIELRKIIIKIGRVQFPYDSDVIKTESYPVLEDVLKKIQQQDEEGGFEKILVEGHTSSEGSDEYNLTLSQKRAEAVKKWLAQHGIPAEKIEPIGYGESRLLKPDEGDEAAMEDNRRVEFIFEEKVVEGAKAPEGSPPPEEETAE